MPPNPWTRARLAGQQDLPAAVAAAVRAELPRVAEQVVSAIQAEVPSYADPFRGKMGRTIENAVALALGAFLDIASGAGAEGPATPVDQVTQAAYDLGRGEVRGGRTMDALLSAYRVGARVAWRDMSAIAVRAGLPAESVARFAELVFAYIDELSATSAAGHADELATSGRIRQRHLEQLTQSLLRGVSADALQAAAERADWPVPATLTAVVLPEARARAVVGELDPHTLQPSDQPPELEEHGNLTVLLVPHAGGSSRTMLLRALRGREAVVGPARPWALARQSYARALRLLALGADPATGDPVDTEAWLPTLVLSSDPDALADLRAQALAPLAELRPAVAEKLQETLRSWLLHQGRREEVAAALFVHPQTVRYRMQQLRELYGERLQDPDWVLRLTLALA